MSQFVVVVHDVGQCPEPQSEPDRALSYFRSWWEAGGWTDEPIYLAAVPGVMGDKERGILIDHCRGTNARVCLHGWDHKRGKLGHGDLSAALAVFPDARTVCPPYFEYDDGTYEAMASLGLRVIFGGLNGEHHQHGTMPTRVGADGSIMHYSAMPWLYAHSYRMVGAVRNAADLSYPLVVNVHHRWDAVSLSGVARLREALAGRIVALEET